MGYKLISRYGDMLPIMSRIAKEGEDVSIYLPKDLESMYSGILPVVHTHTELDIQAGDVIIFDMVGAGKAADILKEKGYEVIGAGTFNDALELDRFIGEEFMNVAGVEVPNSYRFWELHEAWEFISQNPFRYVFKPLGNKDTSLTYVSSSQTDMLRMLSYLVESCDGSYFQLQQYVEGIEMSTEAWFNGEKFVLPVNSTMEEKRFMNGGVGPNTGCMGNVVWAWNDEISEYLLDTMFRKLEPKLAEENYLGPLDINAIWTPDGPHGLEFTARFGYDAFQALSLLINVPLSEFFQTLSGIERLDIQQDKYAMSVRVSIPPYPNDGEVPELPIAIPTDIEDNVFLSDVKSAGITDDYSHYTAAGNDGYLLCIAEMGSSLATIREKCLIMVESCQIPHAQYRTDIGNRVKMEKMEIMRYLRRLVSA